MRTAPPTAPHPRVPRRPHPAGIALALLALAVILAPSGCGREDDLIGTGPIRSISVGADGTAFVLRAWRDRTPNAAVLLVVDPMTGTSAPILPKLGGHRGASIREIEFAVARPVPADAAGAGDAGDAATTPSAPPELVIGGPDIGIAIIRGPFAYLGAFPEVEITHEGRFLPPAGGPATVRSPDGRHLLLFEAIRPQDDRRLVFRPVFLDLQTLELTRVELTAPSREGAWTVAGGFRLSSSDESRRIDPDGSITPVDPDLPENGATPSTTDLAHIADLIAAATGRDDEPVAGSFTWPASDRRAATSTFHGMAWTAHEVYRLTSPDAATPPTVAVPLTLRFDRGE